MALAAEPRPGAPPLPDQIPLSDLGRGHRFSPRAGLGPLPDAELSLGPPASARFLLGPCGVGKTWLACALAEKACRDGFTAFFRSAPKLLRDLALARADGSLSSFLARLAKIDVLVVDDWVNSPLPETERRDFLEICEDRYQLRSTILTSQIPVKRWHEQIGDPTLADSILDRLVHNAHQIELQGKSARKELHGKDGKGS